MHGHRFLQASHSDAHGTCLTESQGDTRLHCTSISRQQTTFDCNSDKALDNIETSLFTEPRAAPWPGRSLEAGRCCARPLLRWFDGGRTNSGTMLCLTARRLSPSGAACPHPRLLNDRAPRTLRSRKVPAQPHSCGYPLQTEDTTSCGDMVQHIALRRLSVHSAIGLGIAYILSSSQSNSSSSSSISAASKTDGQDARVTANHAQALRLSD